MKVDQSTLDKCVISCLGLAHEWANETGSAARAWQAVEAIVNLDTFDASNIRTKVLAKSEESTGSAVAPIVKRTAAKLRA